ncbi:hypothetical protein TTHERM_00951700 (macronuclear) [Tetrahymena thermophila SB210]|uniref:Uncharacterized protein n=1 Tax=Tetrahymena thermophila (strain SB210) TaxID=312017 RepID=Q241Y4_TETTS|nr:hypothetical protein TTHERM_00951700 [Tetrahymena thermophila SB210]EAS02567.2 hypothetical protein TTHERM_00951700 [Tetrahymena thermophila SB210]|eukprot:XP_001022812.2 hypothetical protein TTHERM_00951700 [Tetrahymena thermophila SB210]
MVNQLIVQQLLKLKNIILMNQLSKNLKIFKKYLRNQINSLTGGYNLHIFYRNRLYKLIYLHSKCYILHLHRICYLHHLYINYHYYYRIQNKFQNFQIFSMIFRVALQSKKFQ